MPLRAAHNRLDACDQFVLVKGLGHVVIGTNTETSTLVLNSCETGKNQDRSFHVGDAQSADNLETRHVRKVQIQKDDVVIIQLAEVDTLFAQIRRVLIGPEIYRHYYLDMTNRIDSK